MSLRARQLGLTVTLALVAAALAGSDALLAWERDAFDVLSRRHTSERPSARTAVVLLDEASLDWGRAFHEHVRAQPDATGLSGHEFLFPWDRSVYDLMVQFAALGGARVVSLDVELAGPHPTGDPAGDATLGLTTRMQNEFGAPFVVHAANLESSAERRGEVVALSDLQRACLAGASIDVAGLADSALPFDRSDAGPYSNPVLPYQTILAEFEGDEALLRLGVVTAQPDPDGVIRRARPLVVWDGQALPSLGLATALAWEQAAGRADTDVALDGDSLRVGAHTLPLTSSGDLLLRWRDGGEGSGRHPAWPAHRVLRSALRALGIPGWEFPGGEPDDYFLEPDVFAERMVLLGANAAGLHDLKATPVSADHPGVFVHAEVAEALLDGHVMARAQASTRALVAALLAVLGFVAVASRRRLVSGLLLVAGLAVAWVAVGAWEFGHGRWFDIVTPLLVLAAAAATGAGWQWFTAGRRSREIAGLFEHFAPPDVVQRLIARPESLHLRGESREITSFFSDIRGFTALANAPAMRADPGRFTDHLNDYLGVMTEAIRSCGGTVDKYIGDAVVALFGAPEAQPDHAARACRAALLCQRELETFNARARAAQLPEFVTRIGLDTGAATVGCVGSRQRTSYTAIGPTVNFASRMEGVNKTYGTFVLCTGRTRRAAGDAITARQLDRVRVPGLDDDAEPLEVHELLGDVPPGVDPEGFEAARTLYEAGRFDDAAEALAAWPDDPPARVLRERCLRLSAAPPGEAWDGTTRLTGK